MQNVASRYSWVYYTFHAKVICVPRFARSQLSTAVKVSQDVTDFRCCGRNQKRWKMNEHFYKLVGGVAPSVYCLKRKRRTVRRALMLLRP